MRTHSILRSGKSVFGAQVCISGEFGEYVASTAEATRRASNLCVRVPQRAPRLLSLSAAWSSLVHRSRFEQPGEPNQIRFPTAGKLYPPDSILASGWWGLVATKAAGGSDPAAHIASAGGRAGQPRRVRTGSLDYRRARACAACGLKGPADVSGRGRARTRAQGESGTEVAGEARSRATSDAAQAGPPEAGARRHLTGLFESVAGLKTRPSAQVGKGALMDSWAALEAHSPATRRPGGSFELCRQAGATAVEEKLRLG